MGNIVLTTVIRSVAAVVAGVVIGSERGRHGRAAGMRTHILVCLGAAITAMTSIFVVKEVGVNGDVFRVSAQVISGIGFLGAGMIILKNNNVITGLTTAAGVWTTGAIGVAIGYGYYIGAAVVTVLFVTTIIVFAKFERKNKSMKMIYLELEDMYKTNETMNALQNKVQSNISLQVVEAKSKAQGHIGINMLIDKRIDLSVDELADIENVVYAAED